MMTIGLIGPDYLLKHDQEIWQQLKAATIIIKEPNDLAKIDGLMITGWHKKEYYNTLMRTRCYIEAYAKDNLVVMGVALASNTLGQNGILKLMDFTSCVRFEEKLSTSVINVPAFEPSRFSAIFSPIVEFNRIAPNLGILCQDKKRGPIILRQGNFLACSYVPELTKNQQLYQYFFDMMLSQKQMNK